MFKFWGSQDQQPQPRPQDGSSQSWYPPSVVSSPNSSRPGTPSSASSSSFSSHRTSDRPQSPSHVSPAEAAGIIAVLKDKSVDELRKLLSDKDAYHHFLLSLDQVKIQNNLRDELHKETLQLARENLENEPPIMELRNQPRPQDGSSQSWYPPSVVSSPNSSRPGTPSSASSSSFSSHRTSDRPQSPSHVSPAEAAGIIAVLKDKSVDELRKLLSDKDAYHHFLLSLDQVKIQNNSRDELRKETLQLARENLEKEPRIMELRNQCRIIRTTELAAAQEKLNELERKKEETLKFYSPQSLLQRLQDANKTEEESENLHKQLLDRDVDLGTFVQKYKKLRTTYHRRALIHLSAKTSSIG
ncbi:vacuolar protein-sorting-associated protein 37 homolog 1-like isoform X41 [Quercus robur]|uniref:vacuolar protein-sorting-associated protein 37 homolog 1-like isoform X40 n=1 Tax=Quercus robur TaxID=38942 RepID=UPI002162AE7C|nr:vacuolar protein-sorting-associated protein 37 homolog 1-like isoform X40 [Quercus robur]XP_050243345.1 vacuolar protein-sorting-associated protein 37 homolog 1-like isoform X41 [Quercus robur]